jgi:regulator of replication initiation timing
MEMDLFDNLLDYDSNDDFSFANAPTPYMDINGGMNDIIDVNDSDLIGFESNINECKPFDFVNNEIVIDVNNHSIKQLNESNASVETNARMIANNQQNELSLTQNDIHSTANTRMSLRKRRISFANNEEEEESDEDQSQSFDITTRKKGKNVGHKRPKDDKCMSRNAIAARENREKKKLYVENLEKELSALTKNSEAMAASMNSLKKRNGDLESENTYLKAVLANMPQIAALIDHMATVPTVPLIGTSFKPNEQVSGNSHKKSSNPVESNSVRKSHRIASKMENPGICFHINGHNCMSLELCNKCSDASKRFMKIKKEK